MSHKSSSDKLLYTHRGQTWLGQFDQKDKGDIETFVRNLTLVSHNEFERNLIKLIENSADTCEKPIALFAIKEIDHTQSFFIQAASPDARTVDALSRGSDHGSEARIATIIRNICKANPDVFLNHPSIVEMERKQCRSITLVDDFIGSGSRARQFLQGFWNDRTIVSWHSLKLVRFSVLAYSGTESGISYLKKHKSSPVFSSHRHCSTVNHMPWVQRQKSRIYDICRKYGRRSHRSSKMWWGYNKTMGMMIFEHGCPNNIPSIFWCSNDKSEQSWIPLFPGRVINSEEQSLFPNEIIRGDPKSTMISVGQPMLSKSNSFNHRDEEGRIVLLILALIAKGQRKASTLGYVTGLNVEECRAMIQKCVNWNLITISLRLTPSGARELKAARKDKIIERGIAEIGSDYYYPKQLRGITFD